jgi:hypothetical protein
MEQTSKLPGLDDSKEFSLEAERLLETEGLTARGSTGNTVPHRKDRNAVGA